MCDDAFVSIIPGFQNTAVWLMANFQYLWLAAAFAVSKPFRQPQWTNVPFSALWLGLLACSVALMFTESKSMQGFLQLIQLPDRNFRWCIATLALLSGLASASLEYAINEVEEWILENRGTAKAKMRSIWSAVCKGDFATAYQIQQDQ